MPHNRIKKPEDPEFAWDYFRAMFPHLFVNGELRRGIAVEEITKPLAKTEIGEHFAWGIFRLVTEYRDYFAIPEDTRRLVEILEAAGVSISSWMKYQRKALARSARRFGGIETVKTLSAAENRLFHRILEWHENIAPSRPRLEIMLWGGEKAHTRRLSQLAQLMLKLDGRAAAIVRAALSSTGLMRIFVLPPAIVTFLDTLVGHPSQFFQTPDVLLYEASLRMPGEFDRSRYIRTYLPAFMHAMADPMRLIDVIASLPRLPGPVAPPAPRSGGWPELVDFLESHHVRRVGFTDWFIAVGAREHELMNHLAIACSSLMRVYFLDGWKAAVAHRETHGRYPYYEDFLGDVARRTKLSIEDLDAWLNMRHVEHGSEGGGAGWNALRFHAFADREAYGRLLRERTMLYNFEFSMMRELDHRPPVGETLIETVVRTIRETRNHFATYHTATDKRGKIVRALAPLELSVAELWKLCELWRKRGTADERPIAFIEEALKQVGFRPSEMPVKSRRIRQAVDSGSSRPPTPPPEQEPASVHTEKDVALSDIAHAIAKPHSTPKTGHEAVSPVRVSTDAQRLDRLSEVIEAAEDYFGGDYDRLSEWVDALQRLVANGKNPAGGIAQLESNMRTILEKNGLKLDNLMKTDKPRGGNKGGGSSPAGGAAPPAPMTPPTMPPLSGTHFFRGALPLVPVNVVPPFSAIHLPNGMLIR